MKLVGVGILLIYGIICVFGYSLIELNFYSLYKIMYYNNLFFVVKKYLVLFSYSFNK